MLGSKSRQSYYRAKSGALANKRCLHVEVFIMQCAIYVLRTCPKLQQLKDKILTAH